jgi:hypothetical protein
MISWSCLITVQVGPMVAMIYRMMSQDLAKFGVVFFIFLMGFSQVNEGLSRSKA